MPEAASPFISTEKAYLKTCPAATLQASLQVAWEHTNTIVPGMGNSQAWDRYHYSWNNPIRFSDPSGHRGCEDENLMKGERSDCKVWIPSRERFDPPDDWWLELVEYYAQKYHLEVWQVKLIIMGSYSESANGTYSTAALADLATVYRDRLLSGESGWKGFNGDWKAVFGGGFSMMVCLGHQSQVKHLNNLSRVDKQAKWGKVVAMSKANQPRKKSSVRHTRAIQQNRSKHPVAAPSEQQVKERIEEIVHPATLGQVSYFHRLGLRERTLGLVVMVAFVLEMIWRQIGGVSELARMVQKEAVLWEQPRKVSQQALSQRLTSLPAELFLRVLRAVLPVMRDRWCERERPLPPELVWAAERYRAILSVDGSTLDALIRKMGLLCDLPENPLAGKITALLDLCTRLPDRIWYESDAKAHDQRFWPDILAVLKAGSLLIFDKGYLNFSIFIQLRQARVKFITRSKSNLVYTLEHAIIRTAAVHDYRVWIGKGETRQLVRLIEIQHRGNWYRYLTNELDEVQLPTAYVVALYWQRWRIEDAYAIVKRLLGLAYFWSGSQNAIELQIWATWLLYVVLIDLTDAVAERLNLPFAIISIEMVYRSLYFFTQARQRGETDDFVAFLAQEAKLFGIIKRKRKSDKPSPLEFIPAFLTDPSKP